MAERSRPNVSANTYEDFQLQVERKEDQGANFLIIHLPGFPKEQISVTYVDSSRTIKVQGERALEKNKRQRFNQAFPVPQDCAEEKIQASFRDGILTITMPKQAITQTARDEQVLPPQTTRNAITDQPKASTEMGRQQNGNAPPKVQPSMRQEETQKKAAAAAIATSKKQAEEKTAGSTSTAAVEEKKPAKKVESSFLGKAKEMKGMETITKSVKRFVTDDYEDRQTLMNIGVSVLVVVALGVHIAYSYRSSGQAED
ncbi:hypothetical protein F3Y22_tig00113719pilonHSYRG00212 [Hibiscus syriacus]|uniref:SHSP domain-containing protein n=1 Tax=Hibiscus syriacus TaxID=106335 RepID=A0A6A2WQI9_HIBSY|nr:hypothetical protein F3Y22_tig00113719pilonHSYRG00212 [Hibiscus syriacus]